MTDIRKGASQRRHPGCGRIHAHGPRQAAFPLGGATLLARAIENVRAASLDEIVLVLGAEAEAIQPHLPPSLTQIVVNQAYRQGMASSLRPGLSHVDASSDAALIVLGDQPFLQPQTLSHIMDGYFKTRAPIVIPSYQGKRGNPVLLTAPSFLKSWHWKETPAAGPSSPIT